VGRILQRLQRLGLHVWDAWAARLGEAEMAQVSLFWDIRLRLKHVDVDRVDAELETLEN
jgi:hypothetical protein